MKRLWGLWLFILGCVPLVQAQECASIVQEALDYTDQTCSATARNQACYGNLTIEAVPQADATTFKFDAPGDIVDVSMIQTLKLSEMIVPQEWGVALLNIQADLPDTVPGQNVTVLLFGNTTIESAETPTLPLSLTEPVDMYSTPDVSSRVVSQLDSSETLRVSGRDVSGDWLRVQLDDSAVGWILTDDVTVEGDVNTLLVVDATTLAGASYGPMQAFYFTSGVGASACAEAPQDGLVIQTPEGAAMITFLINDVSIELGSTAAIHAEPSGSMTFDLLEGGGRLSANGQSVTVPAGARVTIPLDAEGRATGIPTLTTIPDGALTGLDQVVEILPRQIDIAVPLTADQLTAVPTGPLAGPWEVSTAPLFMSCPDEDPFAPSSFTAEMTPTEQGFDLRSFSVQSFVDDGNGRYTNQQNISGGIYDFAVALLAPDHMAGTLTLTLPNDCRFEWRLNMTLQEETP